MNQERKVLVSHQKIFTIEWGDMDALGHVNNTRYFDYFQQARLDWLAELQFEMQQDTGPVLVHIACSFLKPVIYPATLTLKSQLHTPGRSSIIMDHDLLQDTELMAQGTSKIVWVDYGQNKSIALPQRLHDLFAD